MRRVLAALLALLLFSAACGDDGDNEAGESSDGSGAATSTESGAEAAPDQTDDHGDGMSTDGDDDGMSTDDDDDDGMSTDGDDDDDMSTDGDDDDMSTDGDDDDMSTDGDDDDDMSTDGDDDDVSTETDTEEMVEDELRIVSLSPTATEILFAVGAGDQVIAVDQYSYYPDEAPVTDLSGFSPNVEAIAAFEPDIVVMQSNGDLQAGLETLGIEVVVQDAAVSIDDTYAQIEQIGEVTGHQDEATALVTQMQFEIDSLIANAPDGSGFSYFHELDEILYSVTSSTFVGAVYGLFGLANAADPADADGSNFGYPQLSDEYLVDVDPDLIFLADTICCGQDAATVAERPGWGQLSAVQNGNVIELSDDIASRWGPRIVEFIAAISEALRNL